MKRLALLTAIAAALAVLSVPHARAARQSDAPAPPSNVQMAAAVKAELLHAWQGYARYAWGHDELRPLSRTSYDWYGQSLEMTPVDALDTLVIMGLHDDADRARHLIDTTLSFDKDISVKTFEITIRLLGGLLSSYELTHDARLLTLATDLGHRLLPAFDSPTGLPWQFVNLRTGQTRGAETNPAETGTLVLEFGTLSRLTHDPVFMDKARRALVETWRRRSPIGLVGETIDVRTGAWTRTDSHIDGGIDSYYEYLLKCSVLFGDAGCRHMFDTSIAAANKYLADEVNGGLWYGEADMNTGRRTGTTYSALAAFFPAVLTLSGDLDRAKRLQASAFRMWSLHGIEPEAIDYRTMAVKAPGYHLRPEIVESTYYLFHATGDPVYQAMGRTLFEDFVKYCRTPVGYASLTNVITKEQDDEMPTYALAETFKYFYLLFAPASTLNFDSVVFNTEAHPLRKN